MFTLEDKSANEIMALGKSLDSFGSLMMDEAGILKAFEAGEGTGTDMTDLAQLEGGRAISVENIDTDLKITAETQTNLVFYNLLRNRPIYAVLDQWISLDDQGIKADMHSYGKSTNESNFPDTSDTTTKRRVDATKFIRDMRDLTHVLEVTATYADKHQIINNAGAITVLETCEKQTVFGNSAAIPTQFDGIYTQCLNAFNAGFTDAIVDCRATGTDRNAMGGDISETKMDIGTRHIMDNLGHATHMVMPTAVKSDINEILPIGRRPMLPQLQGQQAGQLLGIPASGFVSDFAYQWAGGSDPHFKFVPSIPIMYPDGDYKDMQAPIADFPSAAKAPTAPTNVTAAVASDASSKFESGDAGDYFYRVAAITWQGKSSATALGAAISVPTGNKVTLTITCNDAAITGLAIYRSVKGATDATDCRWIADIAVTNTIGDTLFVDLNLILPGTSTALLLSNAPQDDAISYRQLMPFMRMPLAFGLNQIVGKPYLYMLYTYLRLSKLRNERVGGTYHVLYTNIRSTKSTFDPIV